MNMTYLSYFIGKRIDISLFESVMWQAIENKKSLGLKVNYFNPIIGYQSISSSLNSVDNSMLGLNLKIKLKRKTALSQIYSSGRK